MEENNQMSICTIGVLMVTTINEITSLTGTYGEMYVGAWQAME